MGENEASLGSIKGVPADAAMTLRCTSCQRLVSQDLTECET